MPPTTSALAPPSFRQQVPASFPILPSFIAPSFAVQSCVPHTRVHMCATRPTGEQDKRQGSVNAGQSDEGEGEGKGEGTGEGGMSQEEVERIRKMRKLRWTNRRYA
eukprot:GFKZ01005638.1.p1 GENE.GFKZ01005638.1~~GFKZ01005638.1.p1  ORF type:complete len:106 (+),score=11.71 GFKZ01005638.1:209-526(+)